jgi:hypothetical protein
LIERRGAQIVINVGIDESKSGSLLVVSGIVGKTSLMHKLDTKWKAELATAGVDYFHAKEHWSLRSKAYHDISTAERETLLDRLVGHLHHRFLFGASTLIDEVEYRAATSERFRSQYGSPYAWGFQVLMVVILVELIRQRRQNQPINILIEDGHANSKQAIGFIERKKKLNNPKGLKVGSHGLGGKRDNPILQAADLLAFGICEFHTKGESDFASRIAPFKYRKRFIEYPWDRSSPDAASADILRHRDLRRFGTPGAKPRTELVMW